MQRCCCGILAAVNVAELVRRARAKARVSQAALARQSGVSQSTVLRTENGQIVPTAATLFDLADALSVSYESLREAVRESPTDARRLPTA